MTKQQAENCLTLAYWLSDCMTDTEFSAFWKDPLAACESEKALFHEAVPFNTGIVFGAAGWFVLSGDLTDGLGIPAQRVTRSAIATALVAVVDFAGWETA